MFKRLKKKLIRQLAKVLQHILNDTLAWQKLDRRLDKILDEIKQLHRENASIKTQTNKITAETTTVRENTATTPASLPLLRAVPTEAPPAGGYQRAIVRLGAKPEGKTRSVLFLEQSYYHFFYLARALRARGWDAQLVTTNDSSDLWTKYYHGQDVHLWDEHHDVQRSMRQALFDTALSRFQMMHFAGDGCLSFFPENYASTNPSDIEEWLGHGKLLGYSVSGCNSCVSKETVAMWSDLGGAVVCKRCAWNNRPDVCAPEKSHAFGRKVAASCSLVAAETVPRLDYLNSPKVVFDPLTMCLDPTIWNPALSVPDVFRIENPRGDLLIYHGVGEYDTRKIGEVNIKGTPAIVAAVERLKSEGLPVQLVFTTGMRNKDVRFRQVQADIIVDQLNYGRYGAQAREGMMLGKPVICYINKQEIIGDPLSLWEECPIISATEETVYEMLKELVMDKQRRLAIGLASRAYALKWHSADVCAKRYELIYDALMNGVTNLETVTRTSEWRNAASPLFVARS